MTGREKIDNARAELTEQSNKEGTPLATFIEEYINSKLTTEEMAVKVSGKKLSDLTEKIKNHAKKIASHGCGMVSDDEVKKMADEFYGIASGKEPVTENHEKVDILDLL